MWYPFFEDVFRKDMRLFSIISVTSRKKYDIRTYGTCLSVMFLKYDTCVFIDTGGIGALDNVVVLSLSKIPKFIIVVTPAKLMNVLGTFNK